ncbi:putative tRNA sulfurtransferase [Madurella mycetomatis]|uniref:tRNA sulfurtransferase n=1 Tax=Madurella mycetomatis TaxID=100816 RepID=A0A175VQX3_9PEZI|nr:putative tRNA sulfurtransferase [Madurella mycetomatis]
MCCGRCGPYSAETAHCFHATCVRINRQVPSPKKFFAATRYLFETSAREDRQRELLLQRLMVEVLRRAFTNSHLPVELWFRVARHLVREFAIITAQSQVRVHASAGAQIDLSRDVYASYAIFEGIRYLKTLRNATEAEAERGEYLLMDARRGRVVQHIYIAFDHLGIRQVQFASANRVLPGPGAIPGGMKLRGISVVSEALRIPAGPGWPVREPASPVFLIATHDPLPAFEWIPATPAKSKILSGIPPNVRMARLECNAPGTTGSSIRPEEDSRVDVHYQSRKGHVVCFWSEQALHHPFHCVHKPKKDGSPIYFSGDDPFRDFYLACEAENAEPTVQRPYPLSLIPQSRPTTLARSFFSSCKLEDVAEVTLCRSRRRSPGGVIGLLVRYANGDRACVGSFRFDWASEPYLVGKASRLYLGCSREPQWVKDVRLEPPADDGGLSWMAVPWSGTLEWWFSAKRCEVHHI